MKEPGSFTRHLDWGDRGSARFSWRSNRPWHFSPIGLHQIHDQKGVVTPKRGSEYFSAVEAIRGRPVFRNVILM
jgi:hypothetical protein